MPIDIKLESPFARKNRDCVVLVADVKPDPVSERIYDEPGIPSL
jgi:hypothetical protein